MVLKANAKINVGLHVKKKNDFGYHDLDMVIVPISLCDEIEIVASDSYSLSCSDESILEKDNLVTKALFYLQSKYGFSINYKIHIKKNIPSQAGLGGGSADAACLIRYVCKNNGFNWHLLSFKEIAKEVGADVPFFLCNQTSRVSGIGEEIKIIESPLLFHMILIKPNFGFSTKEIFQNIHNYSSYNPVEELVIAMETNDYACFYNRIQNDLEVVASNFNEEIVKIKKVLLNFGVDAAFMTGSGSTVVGISQNQEILYQCYKFFKQEYCDVFLCTNIQ